MTSAEREKITDLTKCGFKKIQEYFISESEKRKAMTKEEKQKIKEEKELEAKHYGFAIIDGHKQKIGNFRIEPPGNKNHYFIYINLFIKVYFVVEETILKWDV